jgi:hypothetical protein
MPIGDDDSESTAGQLIIPVAAKNLGITAGNMGNKVAGTLPRQHWASSMQAGQVKIDKGAVYAKEPRPLDRPVFVDAALDEQPKLTFAQLDSSKLQDVTAVNRTVVDWLAQKSGKSLAPAGRDALRRLYLDTHDRCVGHTGSVQANATEAQVDAARQSLAAEAAKLLLEERKLFDGNDKAQDDRFGRPIITHSRQVPKQQEVQDAVMEMLRGAYMKGTATTVSSEATESNAEPVVTAIGSYGTTIRLTTAVPIIAATTQTTTRTVAVGSPTVLGWEARMYVAEHDLFATDWEVMYGIDGIVHTSVAAGVWRVEEQDFDVQTFQTVSSVGTANITVDAIRRLAFAQPTSTQRERRTRRVFAGWLVGNGCASTYFADDELTLFGAAFFTSYEAAARWIKTLTATQRAGKYYPIRGCAYCVGNYGVHWVCHQTANAFSVRKWAKTPVSYTVSTVLFGTYGLLGISERLDAVNIIHHGCAAGTHCFYNNFPPYADPVLAQLEEAFMTGHAFGVDTHWNPRKGQWVQSEASYRSHAVPIPGWTETISVQAVSS